VRTAQEGERSRHARADRNPRARRDALVELQRKTQQRRQARALARRNSDCQAAQPLWQSIAGRAPAGNWRSRPCCASAWARSTRRHLDTVNGARARCRRRAADPHAWRCPGRCPHAVPRRQPAPPCALDRRALGRAARSVAGPGERRWKRIDMPAVSGRASGPSGPAWRRARRSRCTRRTRARTACWSARATSNNWAATSRAESRAGRTGARGAARSRSGTGRCARGTGRGAARTAVADPGGARAQVEHIKLAQAVSRFDEQRAALERDQAEVDLAEQTEQAHLERAEPKSSARAN
jgi:chromosome segregation protein